MQMEQLVINKAKIENENKLMNTEIENIKYKNTVNEKKIYQIIVNDKTDIKKNNNIKKVNYKY